MRTPLMSHVLPLVALLPLAAAAQVEPATSLAPAAERAPDPLARARDYLEVGELNKAERELQDLLAAGSGDEVEARVMLSEVLTRDGRFQEAVDVLDPVDDDQHPAVLAAAGRAWWARADAMRSRGARDDDVWHFFELAKASLVEAAGRAPPGDTDALTDAVTLLLYTFGDHETAYRLADEAVEADASSAEARLARGNAGTFVYWNRRGDDDGGEAAWTRAVEDFQAAAEGLPPERVEPLRQLAWLYEQRGRHAEAVAAAVEMLERNPHAEADLVFGLARRMTDADQPALAARALGALVGHQPKQLARMINGSDDPTGVAARLQWTAFSLDAKRRAAALDAIMAANPRDADVWNNYGLYLRDTGRHEESYSAYERALTFDDTDPRIVNDTAVLLHYYLKRDDERALELYSRAIELANEQLKQRDLDAEQRAYLELALTDARNNLQRLAGNDRRPR